jgi:mRNA-degrading endonuclease RelE of RelBE toxin-antitoxin system
MWRVYVPRPVLRSLARFPTKDADRIWAALDGMKQDPVGGDIRDLGDGTYRRRVGAYRIRFEVDWATRVVSVLWIERRTSTTWRKRHP